MPRGELFSESFASEQEVEHHLAIRANVDRLDHRPTLPDCTIQQRRLLLGPVADITHPEFGRPNLPHETFAIFYIIREEKTKITNPDGKPKTRKINRVDEFIFDHEGNRVSLDG